MDIINEVIADEFFELILDFYPKAFWDTFPQDILKAYPRDLVKSDALGFILNKSWEMNSLERMERN